MIALLPLAALFSSDAATAEPVAFSQLSLKQALARALERSPLVVESTLEWRRVEGAAAGIAGILAENPIVSAEVGKRKDQGWVGYQNSYAGRVEQPLDLLGQAQTRRHAADDQVVWAKARLSLVRAEIAARTQALYVLAQVSRTRIALYQERLATARQSVEALQMRTRLGASSDIDLQLAEAESGRAQAGLQAAQAASAQVLLDLRDLLDLPAHSPALPSDALLPPPLTLPTAGGQEKLLAHHVSVQAVEKRQLAIDSEIARLERERLPRFSIGVAAEGPSAAERFLGVSLSFSPAFWRRNQGPLAEARVERERAEFERTTTLAALERHWVALREEQALRLQQLQAIETTLHSEEAVRTLVRAGWQAGKFDFLRVLLAEQSLAETKQARLDLWANLWANVIEINRVLGQEP